MKGKMSVREANEALNTNLQQIARNFKVIQRVPTRNNGICKLRKHKLKNKRGMPYNAAVVRVGGGENCHDTAGGKIFHNGRSWGFC